MLSRRYALAMRRATKLELAMKRSTWAADATSPRAQHRHRQRHDHAGEPPAVGTVGMVLIPQVAHRRMAIADVHGIWMRDDALRRAGLAGDHEIVAGEVQLLERGRHQGKILLIELGGERQLADVGRGDLVAVDQRARLLRDVDVREDVGLRVEQAEFFQDLFAATHADEPIVDDRNAHRHSSSPLSRAHKGYQDVPPDPRK